MILSTTCFSDAVRFELILYERKTQFMAYYVKEMFISMMNTYSTLF